MSQTTILSRVEVESMGPPVPEEIPDLGIGEGFLCDLALKHVAMLPEPTTTAVAERLHLPRALTEELLEKLYREKLIEVRLQSIPSHPASLETVRSAFHDLILPESLLQTLGCVINSRRSLFLTGLPGTGKTAVAERINNALPGAIWIPYAVEIDGQIIRVFDPHCHRLASPDVTPVEYDRRWALINRPLVIVGGELTLENADLTWSDAAKFYEAPFQMKSNGGTL